MVLDELVSNISIDELLLHDGLHADHPEIWLCVNGKVFDVTRGRSFYGPGGGYAAFAGRDATRALAKMDTGAATRTYAVVSDLTEEEINTAKHWEATFAGKYQFVGTLAPQAN
ncbi:hypothetical protein CAOG_07580 [Capsaspora owczarzaki ATCC 30864]|uniref:Cytochrome b5 heme-binding domain-containing protein n=1 Tax=Capsaspora owczarzaki (strain ATCC 30864) TaxID=595528 RepID=A0A0D2WW31_CAPO3|nr:hypothetical protein CAOG_07580 [Capsaspora owczarzaki ATCC 30864]KJE97110.1 hypothetical protein CAOG_007580 [Capsaspora owczarzaki ATCC 30864]|eukprot:XP_004343454.2 hypothetical protein CAOG_07580 [Capsaspora owczarzaki ATCC 30864]